MTYAMMHLGVIWKAVKRIQRSVIRKGMEMENREEIVQSQEGNHFNFNLLFHENINLGDVFVKVYKHI